MHAADRLIEVSIVAGIVFEGALSSFVRRFTRRRLMLAVRRADVGGEM